MTVVVEVIVKTLRGEQHRNIFCVFGPRMTWKTAVFSLDLKRVQCAVRAEAESVLHLANEKKRGAVLARRVHDSLLACIAIVDSAPQRPGCLRVVRAALPKRALSRCCVCSSPLCLGNRFEGNTLVLVHSKTSRHRDPIRACSRAQAQGQGRSPSTTQRRGSARPGECAARIAMVTTRRTWRRTDGRSSETKPNISAAEEGAKDCSSNLRRTPVAVACLLTNNG